LQARRVGVTATGSRPTEFLAVFQKQKISDDLSRSRTFVRHSLRYDGCDVQPAPRKPDRRRIMHRTKISAVLLVVTILFAAVAADKPGHSEHKPSANKQVDSAFERFKGLAGDWEFASEKVEARKGRVAARFHLTAGGSALVETIFPGEGMEMVTVYHRNGEELMLTHYCHLGNQPRMRTNGVDDHGEVVFHFAGAGDLDLAKETHMHNARIRFVDPNHLHTEWELYRDGKAAEVHKLDLVRKK
jgi:hypothetical protein